MPKTATVAKSLTVNFVIRLSHSCDSVETALSLIADKDRVRRTGGKSSRSKVRPGTPEILRRLDLVNEPWLSAPIQPTSLGTARDPCLQDIVGVGGVCPGEKLARIRSSVAVAVEARCRKGCAPIEALPVIRQTVEVFIFAPGGASGDLRQGGTRAAFHHVGEAEGVR